MLENLLNGSPTGSSGSASTDDGSTGLSNPADLLNAANNAYSSTSSSTDMWSSLSNVLQQAA